MEIDKNKIYDLEEAITWIKAHPAAKFDESVELHIKLGIDAKKTEQNIKGSAVLPHGTGKTRRIAAFVTDGKLKEAKDAGADIVGGTELIDEIKKSGKCDFELAVAEPELMKDLAQIARVLGPRGLMPTPKNETVTKDIARAVKELKGGKFTFKNDNSGNIHQTVGKLSWDAAKLKDNITGFLDILKKMRPAGIKGNFIKNTTLCSTMGRGIDISL